MNAKHTYQYNLLAEPTPGKKSMSLEIIMVYNLYIGLIYIYTIFHFFVIIFCFFNFFWYFLFGFFWSYSDILFFCGRDLFLS